MSIDEHADASSPEHFPSRRKCAVVTGGSSGIGAAVVEALVAQGVRCVVLDIAAKEHTSRDVSYVTVDVCSQSLAETLNTELAALNIDRVDYLVQCAAILHYSPFKETPRATWERVLRTNLDGTIAVAQAVLPFMSRGGRIVLFSSGTIYKGPKDMFAYVASKAGIVGFARCLAEELGGDEITVNVVSPGITATPMMDKIADMESAIIAGRAIKRRSLPEDLVGTVMFLLSDAAGFITGQTICVDGGSNKL